MDPAVARDVSQEGVDRLAQLRDVTVHEEVLEERVLRLGKQVGEGSGIGRVAGLDLLGARHVQLIEQDLLELLRRSQVHLTTDDLVCVLRSRLDLLAELALELTEHLDVDGDTARFHPLKDTGERQLGAGQQLVRPPVLEVALERGCERRQDGGAFGEVRGSARLTFEVELRAP